MTTEFNRQLIDIYLSAPINQSYKPKMTLKKGSATISTTVQNIHFHAANYLHGSAIFKLLDDAAYFSAQSIETTYFLVTSSFNTHFIRPENSGILTATGHIIDETKTQIIAKSNIKNDAGKLVAYGSGCFMKSNIKLDSLHHQL
mgnify:CR=1 FL=1